MGHRAKLKQIRRDIRAAFTTATERQKAALVNALEQRAGLSQAEVLSILREAR